MLNFHIIWLFRQIYRLFPWNSEYSTTKYHYFSNKSPNLENFQSFGEIKRTELYMKVMTADCSWAWVFVTAVIGWGSIGRHVCHVMLCVICHVVWWYVISYWETVCHVSYVMFLGWYVMSCVMFCDCMSCHVSYDMLKYVMCHMACCV